MLVLGSGPGADVRLVDPSVAPRHATVLLAEDGLCVRDVSSGAGLFVAGARVPQALLPVQDAHFVLGHISATLRVACDSEAAPEGNQVTELVGESAPMCRLRADVARIARLRAPVLLQGDSGTGKDVVARALHRLGGRRGSYVPMNMGAVSESLADSELFGHARGSFTGAVQARAGAFEQANGGTLFLDEIGDLAPSIQVKLLRVIEDGCVRPLGATHAINVQTRVVSATWVDLPTRVAEGAFRADLLHRISTVTLRLPALRERKSDIPLLARHLLSKMQSEVGPKRLTATALAALVHYSWPGNVRELASVLYRAAVFARGAEIDAPQVINAFPQQVQARVRVMTPEYAQQLVDAEGGNVSAAARAAGVPRSTFRGWLTREEGSDAPGQCASAQFALAPQVQRES